MFGHRDAKTGKAAFGAERADALFARSPEEGDDGDIRAAAILQVGGEMDCLTLRAAQIEGGQDDRNAAAFEDVG